ncbi:sugar transferase [Kamptonema cortianum]|nr:sugar transferase [Oscillatoria laete-virens]MDK3157918.1 sugar transferase [Kamptonema cortianum]MDL5046048.1 sugar transferase [Oscillatoria amoena NRMC-F 0135]MDL5052754.1 sugar transferase [Oscillatoria laete-virens NRMC-F 0139]
MMRLSQRELEPVLMLVDTVMCLAGVGLAFYLRASDISFTERIPMQANYALLAAVITVMTLFALRRFGLYRLEFMAGRSMMLPRIFFAVCAALAVLFALAFFIRTQQQAYSRLFLILTAFTVTGMVFLGRWGICLVQCRWQLFNKRKTLLVGWSGVMDRLAEAMIHSRFPMMELDGILALQKWQIPEEYHDHYLGTIEEYQKTLILRPVEQVLILTSQVSPGACTEMCRYADQKLIRVGLIPDPLEVMLGRLELSNVEGVPILAVSNLPLDRLFNRLMKRGLDVAGSLFGLVVGFVPGLVIAWLVKMDSPGPAIFGQERIGRGGRKFTMYKFRSMGEGAELQDSEAGLGLDHDPRITPLGQTLRQWNLDELPQLWNVLKGDMSLVGPRPERTYFVDLFKEKVPHYMPRHIYKPGITGLAQVRGHRGNTSLEKRIEADLEYFENWSIWLDLKILIQTICLCVLRNEPETK